MLSIIDEIGDKDHSQWVRQFADSVSAAAQSGGYPAGVDKAEGDVGKAGKEQR